MDGKQTKPIAYKVLRVLSLTPIIVWPFVFFANIFMFDDPNANKIKVWAIFLGVTAYPIYLIGNLLLSSKLYDKLKLLAYALLLWPIAGFGIFIFWFLK